MKDNDCVVYGLRGKKDRFYFYVGSTKHSAEHRLKGHIEAVKKGYNQNGHFVNKVKQIGTDNLVSDVLVYCSEVNRFEVESEWIKNLTTLGHPLTNIYHLGNNPYINLAGELPSPILQDRHIPVILEAYVLGLARNGDTIHDLLCGLVEEMAEWVIEHPSQEFDELFSNWLNGTTCNEAQAQ